MKSRILTQITETAVFHWLLTQRVKVLSWGSLALLVVSTAVGVRAQGPRPARYTVTDLGTLPDGNFSQATLNNNTGVITGVSTAADGSQHAVLWVGGQIFDISSPGLGGPNSYSLGVTPGGLAAGVAESSTNDPNNENFCLYFTGLNCLPFSWEHGVMTPLQLLGGNNGQAGPVNIRGQIVGMAETGTVDSDCPGVPAVNGTGPQVLDFEAVVWDSPASAPRPLKLLDGDTVGAALWINDSGRAVGTTGTCKNSYPPPICTGPHAVLWDKDGSVHDLGSLGGTANPAVEGVGNVAFAINDMGQVTGSSALCDNQNGCNQTVHAFLWTKQTSKMQDLGTLPGDIWSAGLAINNTGDVVGASLSATIAEVPAGLGSSRAVLWHNDQPPIDLNTLVPADSPLYLLNAFGINDAGQVVGFGLNLDNFEIHGFLATPVSGKGGPAARGAIKSPVVPENARKLLRLGLHF
jgi:probable HAF family extracellular repeat protein